MEDAHARLDARDTDVLTRWSPLPSATPLGGLAGAIEVARYHQRLILGLTPGYGAMAILIAVLGRLSPGVGVASVLVAILMVESDSLRRSVGLPVGVAFVFQAIVVLRVLLVEARSAASWTT